MKRHWWMLTLISVALGCGYDDYMKTFRITMAKRDYSQRFEQALGSVVDSQRHGISLRLPTQVATAPTFDSEKSDDESEDVSERPQVTRLTFETDSSATGTTGAGGLPAIPMRVVVITSTVSKSHPEKMSVDALANVIFESRSEWMGEGALSDHEIKLEPREIPAGPLLPGASQEKFPVQWTTLTQVWEDREYLWSIAFVEGDAGTAMAGYRVSKDDHAKPYTKPGDDGSVATVSDAIDMSISTVSIVGGAAPQGDAQPRGRRGT